VYLVGGGDPTIVRSTSSYVAPGDPQPATLAGLARQTADALGHTRRVRLRLDASQWTGPRSAVGWKPAYVTEGDVTPPSALELDEGRIRPRVPEAARTTTPALQAGAVFADLLRRNGVRVIGDPQPGTAPRRASLVGSVGSPTVSQLVQRMLTVSDDDLAEALGRAVARRQHIPASFAGSGRAVTEAARALGVPTRGVALHDTSGLSHADRITPAALVAVLREAVSPGHRQLRPMLAGLPVAGLTGTLSARFLTHPSDKGAGVVRAKTGTLSGVNALAGTVVDRSGRLLIFAFLASHARLPGLTVPGLDALATRLTACGCGQ
jgi:D-alanyl-D-alanine carboxypeptidase/D-alanyl-D-alanine-endopeptidase (penicillin-binding protein 4)